MLNTRESPDKAGRLYPPVAVIEYGEVSRDDLDNGKELDFEFKVSYEMSMKEANKDIEVFSLISPILTSGSAVLDTK